MSYLHPVRLHFAGRFQASPSTVNNDILHYRVRTFSDDYWKRGTGRAPAELNGWWNPQGDSAWRLVDCVVTSVHYADGSASVAGQADPAVGLCVADSGDLVNAKIVDLDPQQQMASEIFGLRIRLCDPSGRSFLEAEFEPAPFTELWIRATTRGKILDGLMGAMWQSILHSVQWHDLPESRFLRELREVSKNGPLSIKFNVDAYRTDRNSPGFTFGRIVGTIGPAVASEPKHFVAGRHLLPELNETGAPVNRVYFCAAVLDPVGRKIILDLGNALPTDGPEGGMDQMGSLSLGYLNADPKAAVSFVELGPIDYLGANWYAQTAGLVALPANRPLTDNEWIALQTARLAIARTDASGPPSPLITEGAGGYYLRADKTIWRLNPGESAEIELYATRFGAPLPDAPILNYLDRSGLQPSSHIAKPDDPEPAFGVPESALEFPVQVSSGPDGKAILCVTARDPGNPRGFIDGQVYGLRSVLRATLEGGWIGGRLRAYHFNPWDFVSLLIWDKFDVPETPAWADLQPIFQQYRNLYPVMARFVNLSDVGSVVEKANLLLVAFSLEPADPNYMPVTRDLSKPKRQAILRWLSHMAKHGGPPPVAPKQPLESGSFHSILPHADPPIDPTGGGKTAALMRMHRHRLR